MPYYNDGIYYILKREDIFVDTEYKGSSIKIGGNPKAIAKRRKKNKNKKTHRYKK